MISIIAAVAKNGVIGKDNKLIWKLPADLQRFKEITTGHTVIMGRKTFESIGRALPNRRNIVITRQPEYKAVEGVEVSTSLEQAIARLQGEPEVFIIGGGELYRQAIAFADRIYLTRIDQDFEGDVSFPYMDPGKWREIKKEEGKVDEKNPHPHAFHVYERA
jgi:dihydrofolate reductase